MVTAAARAQASVPTEVIGGLVDLSKGSYFFLNTGTNLTLTFANADDSDVGVFDLQVGHYGGVITFPSNVRWVEGKAPTGMTAGKIHNFTFIRTWAYGAPDQWVGSFILNA